MLEGFAIAFVLATFVESIIDYFISTDGKSQPWLRYISAILGIGVCLAYRVNVLEALGLVSPYNYVGEVLTGLVVGRGSNYLNDFISRVRNPLPAVVVEAPSTVRSEVTTVQK